jgi:hypothetical protein
MPQNLTTWGSGFTSLTKEGVLRNCIAIKKPSAGFEPATLGSNGKHANHYTAKASGMHMRNCLLGYAAALKGSSTTAK